MDTNYEQLIESFNTYNNKNQTTIGEHAHGKQCMPAPQPVRSHVFRKGPAYMENTEKILTISIIGWLSPYSSGTGPARREKCQLIGRKLKQKKT